MNQTRNIIQKRTARPTREGAGVLLKRVFGEVDEHLDPFLLLDHFGSDRPEDYLAGFPWHPHRGIETITYMLSGTVEHRDSLGNQGVIRPGEVQWMTAGSGIIHQEMPQRAPVLEGFQLWSNLPKSHKMMPPRYREVKSSEIKEIELGAGARAKLICGILNGVSGPVSDVISDPLYLDLALAEGSRLELPLDNGRNVFAYVYRGWTRFGESDVLRAFDQAVFGEGAVLKIQAGDEGARMLLLAGKPIAEPVAWGGPIVMNTEEELRLALQQYRDGTFLQQRSESAFPEPGKAPVR
ncbi:MAG: pirin family protein [Deltaproteobacteria bacterium]|nr:pirin family protein [Deltaproteobacteria bacterium]